jgi:uncharacterized membrane protein SpoIIM required for sporulation
MVSPIQFEAAHAAQWAALETQLDALEAGGSKTGRRWVFWGRKAADGAAAAAASPDPAGVARNYRAACEHLALARDRGYPLHLASRLDALTLRAHRLIYHRPPRGLQALKRFLGSGFPVLLREQSRYLLASTLAFGLPLLLMLAATWWDPSFALTMMNAGQLSEFDSMYDDATAAFGRPRDADTDWMMFGFYVRNNIGVAFQCFATGLLAGLGTLFFLGYNGALIGAVAGYLTAKGLGLNFWSFVATHSAFELTAIVISGAAGLRLGHALLAPGRLSRVHALRRAGADSAVLVGGAAVMLLLAAVIEAFWSSARWLPPTVKFGVAALCWLAVLLYLARSGRLSGPDREA